MSFFFSHMSYNYDIIQICSYEFHVTSMIYSEFHISVLNCQKRTYLDRLSLKGLAVLKSMIYKLECCSLYNNNKKLLETLGGVAKENQCEVLGYFICE
jgi:hypothetical protein